MKKDLFGEYLDIDKLVNNIGNNLNHSIRYNIPKRIEKLFGVGGTWYSLTNRIWINPVLRFLEEFFKTIKNMKRSTVMHELDHCATTSYIKIDEQERDEYIKDI